MYFYNNIPTQLEPSNTNPSLHLQFLVAVSHLPLFVSLQLVSARHSGKKRKHQIPNCYSHNRDKYLQIEAQYFVLLLIEKENTEK